MVDPSVSMMVSRDLDSRLTEREAAAVTQWLDIMRPVVFESAGIFDSKEYQVSTNPVFDDTASEKIKELQRWLKSEIIPRHKGMILEFSKHMDAGLIHPDKEIIMEVYPRIYEYVDGNYSDFEVHYTDVSINIVAKSNNKQTGIQDLCDLLGLNVSEAAYIGDSSGDIPGLKIVGMPFAPANASDEVKKVAREAPYESTRGVRWAYEQIIAYNKKKITQETESSI